MFIDNALSRCVRRTCTTYDVASDKFTMATAPMFRIWYNRHGRTDRVCVWCAVCVMPYSQRLARSDATKLNLKTVADGKYEVWVSSELWRQIGLAARFQFCSPCRIIWSMTNCSDRSKFSIVADSIHTARRDDYTRQPCLVGSGGENWAKSLRRAENNWDVNDDHEMWCRHTSNVQAF